MSTMPIYSAQRPQASREKRHHNSAIAAIAVALAGLAAVVAATPAAAQDTKPNILFIMGDDIGWMQLGVTTEEWMVGETPNIDRLAKEGAIFMCYYAEAELHFRAKCLSSRACIRCARA